MPKLARLAVRFSQHHFDQLRVAGIVLNHSTRMRRGALTRFQMYFARVIQQSFRDPTSEALEQMVIPPFTLRPVQD